jgi:phosphoribosyl-ATP pyrophosphohydrolase
MWRQELLDENSDLVYHLLVLLATNGLPLQDIANTLRQRREQDASE